MRIVHCHKCVKEEIMENSKLRNLEETLFTNNNSQVLYSFLQILFLSTQFQFHILFLFIQILFLSQILGNLFSRPKLKNWRNLFILITNSPCSKLILILRALILYIRLSPGEHELHNEESADDKEEVEVHLIEIRRRGVIHAEHGRSDET
jgi:hypothetical protein